MSIKFDKTKTICFSGHRTEKLPKSKEELGILCHMLFVEIDCSIAKGYDTFMFGGCYGFDLICAEQVLIRKQILKPTDPINLKLIAVVPFEEQASRWNEYNRNKYYDILSKCDDVITLNKQYKYSCYHERNRYMIDNSSKLICYYNGSDGGTRYTVEYAKKQFVHIVNLYDKCIAKRRVPYHLS